MAFPTDIKLERPDDCIPDDDKEFKICVVCGERASGYYFGALVCLPCKVCLRRMGDSKSSWFVENERAVTTSGPSSAFLARYGCGEWAIGYYLFSPCNVCLVVVRTEPRNTTVFIICVMDSVWARLAQLVRVPTVSGRFRVRFPGLPYVTEFGAVTWICHLVMLPVLETSSGLVGDECHHSSPTRPL